MMILAIIGAIGGFLYYRFVGCASGACPITSNPIHFHCIRRRDRHAAGLYRYPRKEKGGTGRMKKVVIIGGVAGGASCAARLRRLDETAQHRILGARGVHLLRELRACPITLATSIKGAPVSALANAGSDEEEVRGGRSRAERSPLHRPQRRKPCSSRRVETGETYTESYDTLVISTGSSPLKPPIPGIDSSRVQTLWTVPDTDRIRALVREQGVKIAAVIGGGFIGLEMAENLKSFAGLRRQPHRSAGSGHVPRSTTRWRSCCTKR